MKNEKLYKKMEILIQKVMNNCIVQLYYCYFYIKNYSYNKYEYRKNNYGKYKEFGIKSFNIVKKKKKKFKFNFLIINFIKFFIFY